MLTTATSINMNELDKITLLEKYFNYELSDAEDEEFKTKLANDETFKEEYEIALVLRAKALKKRKAAFARESENKVPSSKIISFKKYLPLMAAAGLLIFVGIGLFTANQNKSVDTLLAAYENIENAKIIEIEKSGNSNRSKLLIAAETAYNEKKFMDAALKFKQYDFQNKLKDPERIVYGQSLWYAKQYKKALDEFTKIKAPSRDAQWFMALCYIKLHKNKEAKPIIKKLLNGKYGNTKDQKVMKVLLKQL